MLVQGKLGGLGQVQARLDQIELGGVSLDQVRLPQVRLAYIKIVDTYCDHVELNQLHHLWLHDDDGGGDGDDGGGDDDEIDEVHAYNDFCFTVDRFGEQNIEDFEVSKRKVLEVEKPWIWDPN